MRTLRISAETFPPVSIVVCAKNEIENLAILLPLLLQQLYPSFEIILVDDGSEDGTALWAQQYPILRYIRIDPQDKIGLGKKYALKKGIAVAKNEVILLTDADCRPVSLHWLSGMVLPLQQGKDIVLGISPYQTPHSLLGGIITYETAQTAMQYIGYALAGIPYMSVGRNVCYRKSLLQNKSWTQQELSIASGDDDLMVQAVANEKNTAVCLSASGYTTSKSAVDFGTWIRQKLRHYESSVLYKPLHQLLLGAFLTAKIGIYLLLVFIGIYGVASSSMPSLVIVIGCCYALLLTIGQGVLHQMLSLNRYWPATIVFDFLYSIFTVALGLLSRFKTTVHWK